MPETMGPGSGNVDGGGDGNPEVGSDQYNEARKKAVETALEALNNGDAQGAMTDFTRAFEAVGGAQKFDKMMAMTMATDPSEEKIREILEGYNV